MRELLNMYLGFAIAFSSGFMFACVLIKYDLSKGRNPFK